MVRRDGRDGCLASFIFGYAFTGFLLAIVSAGCIVPPDGVTPGPQVDDSKVERRSAVAFAAEESLADYGRRMADNFDAVAEKLEDGSIEEASETNAELAELNKASRHEAFARVDREFQSRFGGEKWDAAKAAKAFREAAKGLRK